MDLLDRVLKKMLRTHPALKQGIQDACILDTWPEAVGEQIAKHARAFQIKGKTLMVEVDHPIWKQELHANKKLAIARLNQKITEKIKGEGGHVPEPWIEEIFLVSKSPTKSTIKIQKK